MRQLAVALLCFLPACTEYTPHPPNVAEVRCLDQAHTAAAQDFRGYAQTQQSDGYITELSQSDFSDVYDRDCR